MHVMESLFAGPDPDGSRRVSVAAVALAPGGPGGQLPSLPRRCDVQVAVRVFK